MIARDPVEGTLRAAIVWAALGGALIALIAALIVGSIAVGRLQHATLDAASVAVRAAVADADVRRTVTALAALRASLDTWGISAAAFDRHGTYLAGDEKLRSDGLPAGRAAAPAGLRQLAIVDTRDGYVLLVDDAAVQWRFRASVLVGAVIAFALVALAAAIAGGRWARARGRAAGRIAERLKVRSPTAAVIVTDPLFGELSADIAAALERLSRSLVDRAEGEDRLRTFLAEAAHELRTPLAIAIGYVGILERGGLADPELAARIVRDVAAEHSRLQRLVECILQLARLDALAAEPDAAANVENVVNEAIALVRPLDAERRIAVRAAGAVWAAIAPDELRDALRNVLENAIRYTPGAALQIDIVADDGVRIDVADGGPGMDAFAVTHAFDRFFRGADRGDSPGSGLGLAIVRRIAERAGGSVTLASAPGAGTTVTLRVPRAASGNSPPALQQ